MVKVYDINTIKSKKCTILNIKNYIFTLKLNATEIIDEENWQ